MRVTIIHYYGQGGELDRRIAELEDVPEALQDMGPWAAGDTIKIVEEGENN